MTTAVEFRNVDIVFGTRSREALDMLDRGATRAEILAKTGAGRKLAVNDAFGKHAGDTRGDGVVFGFPAHCHPVASAAGLVEVG